MFPTLEKAYANPFYTTPNNTTHLSIRITEVLSNRVSIELFLENNAPETFLTKFDPESLKTSVQNSTLLVNYDARVPESMLLNIMGMDELGDDFQRDWFTYLQPVIILAAGLTLLAFEAIFPHTRDKDVLKIIEAGGAPPKGSWLAEKSLLLLSSRDPEAYRRALDMVLKGELRVKKGGLDRLRNAFSKLKKLVINRR
ncbi:MAG: hypothetical protein FGF53_09330 [Candidatus Brockarchaeota archaeon]|nr:hypothetical protein [Candidatus Brockarchaeota archaeon]